MRRFLLKSLNSPLRHLWAWKKPIPTGLKQRRSGSLVAADVEHLEPRRVLAAFEVTTASDVVDGSDGLLSLREAITLAEANADADTITFGDGSSIAGGTNFQDAIPDTITLTNGQLRVTRAVTISGTGANLLTIHGNNASRVLEAYDLTGTSPAVTLSGVTLTGGNAALGGAIRNLDTNFTLEDSVVTGNHSSGKGGGD